MKEITGDVNIKVDLNIYPLEVIYRTCYSYTDKFYLWINSVNERFVEINIKKKNQEDNPNIKEQFGNDLIDFATRWSINKETSQIRETLIKTALGEVKKNE